MNIWRPEQGILVKALGLVWRDGRLLASEITNDDGKLKGVRPLGGRLEFGETWRAALIREFSEELGLTVQVKGPPMVLESIYSHEGAKGHEVLFLAEVVLPPDAYPGDGPIEYLEDNGQTCTARWFDLRDLDCGGPELYPSGLKTLLTEQTA